MFKNIFILIFLFLQIAFPREYFIHLTDKGQTHRKELLQNDFSFLISDKVLLPPKNNPPLIKEIFQGTNSGNLFESWVILDINIENPRLLQSFKDELIIDFAEPVGHFRIDFESNDSLAHKQWYLDKIDLAKAWQITQGNPEIIVGVIDTGIDYLHPDLKQSLWINSAEDLNGNNMLDKGDLNNIDDDGNGFIDDVIGWDFTDAPRFADGGDFKDPDNDPMDEFGTGHGTQVAGIISAMANNITGIAGIAPGVKIMNLRAGTASGYLEEDDVARAILYAVENGARIINMSFGDTALSRFLRDIIHYANGQGVILVASSGNSGSKEVHYPSGLVETISVGASTESDGLAGFSNFGNTVDLVAPGTEIVSTAIGGLYNTVNGTSFSAPIISAVSALLLSQNPQMTPGQVRNILKTSAQDILFSGWDDLSGAGRVSAFNALNIPHGGVLEVTSPVQNLSTADQILAIMGSAAHPDLIKTTIEYGLGQSPVNWSVLNILEGRQIINDTLALLNTSAILDTFITIRIKMDLFNLLSDEINVTFSIDRSPPVISEVTLTPLWDMSTPSMLVSFKTDDICTTQLLLKTLGSNDSYTAVPSLYETKNHRIKIDKNAFEGELEFFIEAQNLSGLKSIADNQGDNFSFSLNRDFKWTDFRKVDWTLPSGYMLDSFTDFDNDGNKEIVISRYDENSGFGPIEIYEFNNGRFDLRLRTSFTAIPRAAGDVDRDGKNDLLLGFGQLSFLLEAKDENSFPTELVWQDTTNFWSAAYADLDNDGKNEIIGRIGDEYVLLENKADNSFIEIARLINPTPGQNRLSVPKIELSDLNGDGVDEIIFGDSDGDLLVYTSRGNDQFEVFATGKTLHSNSTEMITSDNEGSIFTATHTSEDLNYEHEFDARYWSIEFFDGASTALLSTGTINTFGFSTTKDFDSGLKYFRFDGRELLFASFFPELFVFEKTEGQWQPIWINGQARSNTVLVSDLDNDGNDEFYFNDGQQIVGYTASQKNRPVAPYIFSANPLDSNRIRLEWSNIENADNYNIYRGQDVNGLNFHSMSKTLFFTDTTLPGQKYYYSVTTVDSSFEMKESFFSAYDSAQTAVPPKPVSIEFNNERQLFVHFDQNIVLNEGKLPSIKKRINDGLASSVILGSSGQSILVSFDAPFAENENDTLEIANIFGETGVPLDNDYRLMPFIYFATPQAPYVVKTDWISENQIKIDFNEPLQKPSEPIIFLIEPSGETENVKFDNPGKSIIVTFGRKTFTGASGQKSYLILKGLKSENGIALDGLEAISLFRESNGLDKVFVYPQPLKPKHSELVFANLPGNVTIKIYTISGFPVRMLEKNTNYGGVKWDLKDSSGQRVASGVYIFILHWKNKVKRGKFAIIN